MTTRHDDDLLLNAYVDGELDDAEAAAFEARLAADDDLRAACERLRALGRALRAGVPKDVPSAALLARVDRIGMPAARASVVARRFDWRALAATAVIAASLGGVVTEFSMSRPGTGAASRAIVAAHQHALLAGDPVEVASSDRHTVKPWFDAHLAISPPVADLAADGFPLVGGRIETIGDAKVPVLVFRHHEHLISVVAEPEAGGTDTGAQPVRTSRDGYTVLAWRGVDFRFSAVSDVADVELTTFVAALRQAYKAG